MKVTFIAKNASLTHKDLMVLTFETKSQNVTNFIQFLGDGKTPE